MQPPPSSPVLNPYPLFLLIMATALAILVAGIGSPWAQEDKGMVNPATGPAKPEAAPPGQSPAPIVMENRQSDRPPAPVFPGPPPQLKGSSPSPAPQVQAAQEPPGETWPRGFHGDLTGLDKLRQLDITRRRPARPAREPQVSQPQPPPPSATPPRVQEFNFYPPVQVLEPYPYYPYYWLYPRGRFAHFRDGFVQEGRFRSQVPGTGRFSFGEGFRGGHGGLREGGGFRGR